MASPFTYSGDPSQSDLDAVRFHLGDTNPDEPLLSDGEINYLLAELMPVHDDVIFVAAWAAEDIAGKFSREVNVGGDGANVNAEALSRQYFELAASLRARMKAGRGGPTSIPAGGIDLYEAIDPSIKPFHFGMGMHDNDRAGRQNYGGDTPPTGPDIATEESSP